MIPRYSRPEMASIWEPESRFAKWLEIEILAAEAWAQKGRFPKSAIQRIRKKAKFNVKRIDQIEKKVKHDVIAFLTCVAESVGPESRFLHQGLTSSDVLDTALSWQLKEASELLIKDQKKLLQVIRKKTIQYKNVAMIGRSHGIHAEPITFGLKVASWYQEMKRNLKRLEDAKKEISYGKLSGAVGTYANSDPSIEKYVCKKLGLKPNSRAPKEQAIRPREVIFRGP